MGGLGTGFVIDDIVGLILIILCIVATVFQIRKARTLNLHNSPKQKWAHICRRCLLVQLFLCAFACIDKYGLHGRFSRVFVFDIVHGLISMFGSCLIIGVSLHYLQVLLAIEKLADVKHSAIEKSVHWMPGLFKAMIVCVACFIWVDPILRNVAIANGDKGLLNAAIKPERVLGSLVTLCYMGCYAILCYRLWVHINDTLSRVDKGTSVDLVTRLKASKKKIYTSVFWVFLLCILILLNVLVGVFTVKYGPNEPFPVCANLASIAAADQPQYWRDCIGPGFGVKNPEVFKFDYASWAFPFRSNWLVTPLILSITWVSSRTTAYTRGHRAHGTTFQTEMRQDAKGKVTTAKVAPLQHISTSTVPGPPNSVVTVSMPNVVPQSSSSVRTPTVQSE